MVLAFVLLPSLAEYFQRLIRGLQLPFRLTYIYLHAQLMKKYEKRKKLRRPFTSRGSNQRIRN